MRSTARLGAVVIAIVVGLTTSGCVGLPGSSAVQDGQAVNARPDDEPLAVEPLTAAAFDDPRQIATGFLRAQMSSRNNYAAARSFLTGGAQWKPSSSVTVFSGKSDVTATRPDTHTVRLSVPVVATLSADGHLTSTAEQRRTLDFTVVHARDGWRLQGVPKDLGVWMSDADVPRLFTRANVYYPAVHGHTLIPDERWLPRQGVATALARAALTPPPAWLKPAVADEVPAGTSLGVEAVPVTDGVASVDLTNAATKADNGERTALWAAMTATVLQAPEVRALNLTVGSGRLEAENLPNTVTSAGDIGYDVPSGAVDTVISRSGSYLAWTHANASDAVSGTDRAAAQGRAKLPAVSGDWTLLAAGQGGRQVAAVSKDRTSLRRWVNGSDVTVKSFGTGLVRPAFDVSGWLWCAGHAFSDEAGSKDSQAGEPQGSLWGIDTVSGGPDVTPRRIDVPWLAAGSIESLSLSPEGQRLAMIVKDGDSTRAVVAAVVRDAAGHPVGLGPQHLLANGVTDLADVAWADATSLVVLGRIQGQVQPGVLHIDGDVTPLGPVPSAGALASTLHGSEGLFVRASRDTVYTRLGSSWSSFLTGGDVIVPTS